jgi:hypothetical protein
MADEFGVDSALAIECLLEWKDNQHLRNSLLHPAKTAALPGPELGGDEPNDWNAGAVQMASEPEVYVRKVYENGDRGPLPPDGADEAAVTRVDVGDVAKDLRDTHDRDILRSHHLLLALSGHLNASKSGKGGVGDAGPEGADELCAVGVAGCLACGEEDARVGAGSDESSLSLSEYGPVVKMVETWRKTVSERRDFVHSLRRSVAWDGRSLAFRSSPVHCGHP